MQDEYEGTSPESFEEAVRAAMPPINSPVPESFDVTLSVSHGGVVGLPQFRAVLRRTEPAT